MATTEFDWISNSNGLYPMEISEAEMVAPEPVSVQLDVPPDCPSHDPFKDVLIPPNLKFLPGRGWQKTRKFLYCSDLIHHKNTIQKSLFNI